MNNLYDILSKTNIKFDSNFLPLLKKFFDTIKTLNTIPHFVVNLLNIDNIDYYKKLLNLSRYHNKLELSYNEFEILEDLLHLKIVKEHDNEYYLNDSKILIEYLQSLNLNVITKIELNIFKNFFVK